MILDTNGLSAIADGEPKLEAILREAYEVAVPVIVLGEFIYGIHRSRERIRYERWLAAFIPGFRVLSVDEETPPYYAAIRHELRQKGRQIPSNDVWIAALAQQHALPLLSRDRHFELVPDLTCICW